MNNSNRIIQADYRADLLTEVLQLIDTERLDVEEPAIAIYRHVWLCLQQEGQVADFERLTELLRKHPQVFAHSELREIYRYAQNFCINKINSGEANFRNHLLHLYRYQLEAGLYLIDGSFPANDFKNIVTLGLSVKAYEWVKSFMQDYHIHLLPQQHDNVYNYNLAQYYFVTKAYDKAVGLLRSVKFTDRYYDINSSIILLKTYLALEDYDSFHYLLDAYKIRMQRNREVATGYRKSIVNFLRLCKQVGRMKERKDYLNASEYKTRQVKLKEQIEATQPLFDRKWLLNTLNPRIS